jgi:hypothetical protein
MIKIRKCKECGIEILPEEKCWAFPKISLVGLDGKLDLEDKNIEWDYICYPCGNETVGELIRILNEIKRKRHNEKQNRKRK